MTDFTLSQGGHYPPCDQDREIAKERLYRRSLLTGPLVGDWVVMPNGKYYLFSYKWDENIQFSSSGSFCLLDDGHLSFSGGLEPGVPLSQIKKTEEFRPHGMSWFFHRDYRGAGRAIIVRTNFPVYWYIVTKIDYVAVLMQNNLPVAVFLDNPTVKYIFRYGYSIGQPNNYGLVMSDCSRQSGSALLELPIADDAIAQSVLTILRDTYPSKQIELQGG